MVWEQDTDRFGHLEVEDYGPYQPQRELRVSVGNVIISDVHQLDLDDSRQTEKHFRITALNFHCFYGQIPKRASFVVVTAV